MEGDPAFLPQCAIQEVFQSTPSAWRETHDLYYSYVSYVYFNPLPPHGGRRDKMSSYIARKVFQSTPSAWRETDSESTHENEEQNFNPLPPHGGRPQFYLSSFSRGEISIHSLRMEGDLRAGTVCTTPCKFQSTPSAWRETPRDSAVSALSAFQSTPSAWRETQIAMQR